MAFSKTPVNSTYSTKEVPLVREMNSRGTNTSKDEYMLNCYPELVQNKASQEKGINIIKRAGTEGIIALPGTNVRGTFLWKDTDKLFVAVDANVLIYNCTSGALITTLVGIVNAGTTPVGFEEFLYEDTTVKIVVTDGTKLSTVDNANTVVTSVDADMPIHLPYPIFIDGYLMLLKVNSSDLYNSDLNDPLAWTPGQFITAEMRPDQAIRAARLNNYVVVFGSKSIEYFYNAGNATGSPFSRNDSPVKSVGYLGGLASIGNKLLFVGESSESNPDVFEMEDFKITPTSNDAIRRHLKITMPAIMIFGVVASFHGHDFYVLNTGSNTYVMELESKLWSKWSYKGLAYFPIVHSVFYFGNNGYRNFFINANTALVSAFNVDTGADQGVAFPSIIVGDVEEFDSYGRKACSRLIIWADKPTSSQQVLVQWSDDDYQTYSTGQYVEMFQELPCIYRLGAFRRRAHKFTYTGNLPWRINKVEVDLNLGT